MTAVKPRYERGPIPGVVFAPVSGGQMVAPGSGGTAAQVGPAALNAINCLGVSTLDALPVGTSNTGTTPEGYPILNTSLSSENTSIARHGTYPVQAGGSFAYGDKVKCGAAGTVVKWVDGTDTPGTKVGQCVDPNGGTNGSKSLIDLSL